MEKLVFVSGNDFQEARKNIDKNKGNVIVFSSESDELNKKILEKEKINVLLLNLSSRKDKMKQRDSGLNHVLSKIAKKKNIEIGINLDEIIKSDVKEKSKIIGRIRQNIQLCKKNKIKMKFISKNKKDKRDLVSLGLALGMPTGMTKWM